MAFGFLTNTAPETAREEYISWLRARGFEAKPERVAAVEASGRTSACGIYANCCAPHYAACAMDGIAIAASASFGCSETRPAVLGAGSFTVVDTGDPLPEAQAAWDILRAIGLRTQGVQLVSCPTCGRTCIDVAGIAARVEKELKDIRVPLKVAVMGCIVNGPGEAREADVGIAGGKSGCAASASFCAGGRSWFSGVIHTKACHSSGVTGTCTCTCCRASTWQ